MVQNTKAPTQKLGQFHNGTEIQSFFVKNKLDAIKSLAVVRVGITYSLDGCGTSWDNRIISNHLELFSHLRFFKVLW